MHRKSQILLLEELQEQLWKRLERCDLCPRQCHANRLKDHTGYCGAAKELVVYTAFLHHGEEPAISGFKGSGAIFFSGCNLKCVYCQNHRFSHTLTGNRITSEQLATIMTGLQERGAENINLVTGTHFLPQICRAISLALAGGLSIPIVYNTSGYEREETVRILEHMVDVYLADMKYITPAVAAKYSKAADYPSVNQRSLLLMSKQKEVVWDRDLLRQGLVIRHLVLPRHADESMKVLSWISRNLPQALVSLMFQYRPYSVSASYPEIDSTVSNSEYRRLRHYLDDLNLDGWVQDLSTEEELAGVHFKPSLEGLPGASSPSESKL